MGQFENVLRGDVFLWFLATLIFCIFIIIKLIKNMIDINDERAKPQQRYGQGQKGKKPETQHQQVNQSQQRFDHSVIRASKPSQDDTIIERWLKKVHQFETMYMPILFPFALNVMTGTTYTFLMVMFFVSLFCFLIFNLWKLHRQCVEHKVLRVILENLSYVLSFFLLLNVWTTGTNPMPYVVVKG